MDSGWNKLQFCEQNVTTDEGNGSGDPICE